MSTEKLDWAAVIADLESKRAALDTAIASLKTVLAYGSLGPSEGISYVNLSADLRSPSASGGDVPDGAFHGKSIPAAVKLYLGLVNKKQTAREISDGLKRAAWKVHRSFSKR